MTQTTLSELPLHIKAEIEKLVEKLVAERTQQENTTVLQRIEALTLELSRQNQELIHQRELIKLGFEMTDKRFEEARHYSDKHFEDMNKRLEDMNKRFNGIQWMIGIGFTVIVILMTLFKFLDSSQGT